MLIDVVKTSELTEVTFTIIDPTWIAITFDIHTGKADADAALVVEEITRAVDNHKHGTSLCQTCPECNWYQAMTLIRRCVKSAAGAKVDVTLKNTHGMIDYIDVTAGVDQISARIDRFRRLPSTGVAPNQRNAAAPKTAKQSSGRAAAAAI